MKRINGIEINAALAAAQSDEQKDLIREAVLGCMTSKDPNERQLEFVESLGTNVVTDESDVSSTLKINAAAVDNALAISGSLEPKMKEIIKEVVITYNRQDSSSITRLFLDSLALLS